MQIRNDIDPEVWHVSVDADELMCDVRALSYATCIGAIDKHGSIHVWKPTAGNVPRGYKRAAWKMLERAQREILDTLRERAQREVLGALLPAYARSIELRPGKPAGAFCERLGYVVTLLRKGFAFEAGQAYQTAREDARSIHDGELRAAADDLLMAVAEAVRTARLT